MSDTNTVGRGATFLFIESIISMFSGYAFWFLISLLTTPGVLGTASTIISICSIFVAIVTLGVPTGVQRFLGKSFSIQDMDSTRIYVKVSVLIVSLSIILLSLGLVTFNQLIDPILGIDFTLLLVAIAFTASTALMTLFRSIVVASLRTRTLPLVMLIAVIFKIVLAITLILSGNGVLGVVIGITAFPVLASVLLSASIIMKLRSAGPRKHHDVVAISRNILKSSSANWIPAVIATVGVQLGTVAVFGGQGADAAGVYFIAFSLAATISVLVSILFSIGYPMLSAMTDGRKKYAAQLIKLSLLIGMPLSSFLMFYADDIMQLFGKSYVAGSNQLMIIMAFTVPSAVTSGITSLLYAYGNYKEVLAIGISTAIPRSLLYFILVISAGGFGAAVAYCVGTLSGFILSMVIAHRIRFSVPWREIGYIFLIPTIVSFALNYFNIHYVLALLIVIASSFTLFVRLRLLTADEARSALGSFPPGISFRIINLMTLISKPKASK